MKKENLNTLYGVIKREAARRRSIYENFPIDHPDCIRLRKFHNSFLADLIREYKAAGGKRDISRFIPV